MRTITNNEVLFTCDLKLDTRTKLSLCKQSYSDGTCFYTLKDRWGNWKVEHGNKNLKSLIEQMEHELKIEKESANQDYVKDNPAIQNVYDQVIKWREDIINNMKVIAFKIA